MATGCVAPLATGMSARPAMSSSVNALWVATSTAQLPNTVVSAATSSSGEARARKIATASSMPGSVSMITLRVDMGTDPATSPHGDQLHVEQARHRAQLGKPVTGAERPVVADTAR